MITFKDFLRTGKAAKFIGVSPPTLRKWSNEGLIKFTESPSSGYRLFFIEDLVDLLNKLEKKTILK